MSGAASDEASLGPIAVALEDQYGNLTTSSSDVSVGLASSDGIDAAAFSSLQDGGTTSSVTISAGQSSVSFYYGDQMAGTPTITASSSPLTSATQVETISAGDPSELRVTSLPAHATASSSPTTPLTVTLADQYGNATTSTSDISVALGSDHVTPPKTKVSDGADATFATSSGGPSVSSVTLPAGSSAVNLFYGESASVTFDNVAENNPEFTEVHLITVSANELNSGQGVLAIVPAPASEVAVDPGSFASAPAGSSPTNALEVAIADPYGNLISTREAANPTIGEPHMRRSAVTSRAAAHQS